MSTRPATRADLRAIGELRRRSDTVWFGAPEHDDAEIAEAFDLMDDPAAQSRLIWDGDRLIAAGFRYRSDAELITDPGVERAAFLADLLGWLVTAGAAEIEVLDRDAGLRAAFVDHGWTYRHSAFDLRRSYADGWTPPEPRWPPGVTVRDYRAGDAAAVHHLIYDEARFADTPGHFRRDLDEWHRLFVAARPTDESPLLACRGERVVGAAIGRTFSDRTGWINQLAVAGDERGAGIGTALMAAYFARRRAAGATSAGLGVMSANRAALRLYLSFGLEVERELCAYAPPRASSPAGGERQQAAADLR